jgi:hypothetical protein
VELARAVRLAGASRSAPAGPGYDNTPVSRRVGPRCHAAMRSHGAIRRCHTRLERSVTAILRDRLVSTQGKVPGRKTLILHVDDS